MAAAWPTSPTSEASCSGSSRSGCSPPDDGGLWPNFRRTDRLRYIVLTIVLVFILALGVLTALDIAHYGLTAVSVLA